MAATIHLRDRDTRRNLLAWPLGEPMTFYSVEREAAGPGDWLPFVRDFHYASQHALRLRSLHGGTWVVRQWEWHPDHDEVRFVQEAAMHRPVTARLVRTAG
jgi:hypothetical protein